MKIKDKKVFYIFLLLSIIFLVTSIYWIYNEIKDFGKTRVALLKIKGTISYDSEDIDIECVIDKIKRFNNTYKYLILEIESPGGSATEVKRILRYLDEYNGTKIAYIRKIGTSGAYWLASSTDYIIAEPYSIVGSVGVTFSYLTIEGLLNKLGIKYVRIVRGDEKDIGTALREPTEKEKKYLEKMINKVYLDFSSYVLSKRNIKNVSEVLSSKFFIAEEGKKLGLIDKVGDIEDVKEYIANKENTSKQEILIEEFSCEKEKGYLKELLGLSSKISFLPRFQLDVLTLP